MKNAPPPMGLEPTTVVVLFVMHPANHLHRGGLRCWQKLANFYCTATELLALCYPLLVLVGWPPTTNNTQTKFMQLAERLWVRVQVQPIFSLITMLILGIVYNAKVGLKLRLSLTQANNFSALFN